jgi:selenide,water dikinase
VATTDFLTPVVDDPRTWGRIAAQNAVSDVYAMGGRPLFALNLVGWPSAELPMSVLAEVLAGGASIGTEGGFPIVGGHSVDDPEPKYGLAVVGEVHPDRILTNAGLRDGDVLVLTKALGIGVATTAIKAGTAPESVAAAAVASMTASNAAAARAAVDAGATGCTDVTGFGLLGHLREVCAASGVHARVASADLPLLPGAELLARADLVPGGSRRNRAAADAYTDLAPGVDPVLALLAADAQTSGGLLAAVASEHASAVGWVIGEIVAGEPGRITLV